MIEYDLKFELAQIKSNNYIVNSEGIYNFYALHMLKYIKTTDETLRDDLIYDVLSKWIIDGKFNDEELNRFLDICLDNDHLTKCVGLENDDTVFVRTFSALIIGIILYYHNQNKFLSVESVVRTKEMIIDYYKKESDLRGYVNNKGWAHSVAHGADVLDELAKCSVISKKDLKEILSVLKLKICQGTYVYIDGEGDRMATAVKSIFERYEINEDDKIDFIDSFSRYKYDKDSSIGWYHINVNVVNFLKSLYFILKGSVEDELINKIEKLIISIR